MARTTRITRKQPEQAASATDQPRRFIKLAEVKTLTTLSTSEIYRRIAAGTFPAQVTLGPKSVAWVAEEVNIWCDSLIAQRGEAA